MTDAVEMNESVASAVHPHNYWAAENLAEHAESRYAALQASEPELVARAEAWADLLLGDETPNPQQAPELHEMQPGERIPDYFQYSRSGEFHDPNGVGVNPNIYLALNMAVRARDPDAFVTTAPEGTFEGFYDNGDEQANVHYFVVGKNTDDAEAHPADAAEKALVVCEGQGNAYAYLAPKKTDETAAAVATAREAAADSLEDMGLRRRREAAVALGEAALDLTGPRAANLAAWLSYELNLDYDEPLPAAALEAIAHVLPADAETPTTLYELMYRGERIEPRSMLRALATIFPGDKPSRLAGRLTDRAPYRYFTKPATETAPVAETEVAAATDDGAAEDAATDATA
jgi:hypothetical protein